MNTYKSTGESVVVNNKKKVIYTLNNSKTKYVKHNNMYVKLREFQKNKQNKKVGGVKEGYNKKLFYDDNEEIYDNKDIDEYNNISDISLKYIYGKLLEIERKINNMNPNRDNSDNQDIYLTDD